MRKLVILTLVFFLASLFAPLGEIVRLVPHYTYANESFTVPLRFEDVYEPVASLSREPARLSLRRANGVQSFVSSKNMFVLRIPRTFAVSDASEIRLSLNVSGKKIPLEIDPDGRDGAGESYYFTEPVFLDPTDTLVYSIETRPDVRIASVSILGLDTDASTMRLTIGASRTSADANTIPWLITRSEWWADETLRYSDHPTWKQVFEEQAANADKPKSAATIAYEKRVHDIRAYLAEKFSEQDAVVERITEENGHSLVWPIEKTKRVEKIIVHHTADDNRKDKDDLSLIRGIYYYHTIVRGWGDIGYHYLVGQRGQIYEGRMGGDYAVSAHALWNNKSTVGVSVMGNFMTDNIVAEQEKGIRTVIAELSERYGIDIHKTSISHKECATKDNCLLKDFETPNLLWHRDVGYTSCPGDKLFALVGEIRKGDTASAGLVYRDNPRIILTAAAADPTPIVSSNLNRWPNIKIRLSYTTGSSIRIKSADSTLPRLALDTASGMLRKNLELPFEAYGTDKVALVLGKKKYPFSKISMSAPVVAIPSWNRQPTWDKTGTYNDNLFRGTITLTNEWGKLTVVNELPLEDYLRGLAEFSNTDNSEKIKTIIVAARSYAYFYTSPSNRKFPGKSYDGSDNPDEFQKYLGYGYEKRSPNANKLVDETNGEIVTYNGTPIKPWYFNESDGRTRSAKEYCEARKTNGTLPKSTVCEDIPYLQSVSDPGGVGHTLKWHGVGISGIGATYLATTLDFKYIQIIQYYLEGVKVEKKY